MRSPVPSATDRADAVLDLVGVGFGPSNLAVAVALAEQGGGLTARFVERQPRFGWHRGMLLQGATMRVSYLKDLATMRNPGSPHTFLAYLHSQGRLADFINYGSSFPLRSEFHDYLEWVAGCFSHQVHYDSVVRGVRGVAGPSGRVEHLEVDVVSADRTDTLRARNVVLSTGLAPRVPEGVVLGERIWHTSELVHRSAPGAADRVGPRPRRVAVLGAGQSAAESVEHLHRRYPDAEVCAVFGRYGYSPADDSPFANRIFDPGAVDDFHRAPADVRALLMGYHANTNYSVVDPDLIDRLYRTHYEERVVGRERLRFLNASVVAAVTESPERVDLVVESLIDGVRQVLACDLVVCATGYHSSDPAALLGDLAAHCLRDASGRLDIGRDYRVATTDDVAAGIFVQGATEHTHGITSTLLSTVAVRSGEIVDAIAAAASRTPDDVREVGLTPQGVGN